MIPPFDRTSCDCDRCSAHCREQPGCLTVGDFERIAAKMQLPEEQAIAFFRSSGGTVTMDHTGAIQRTGSIVPAADSTGRCVFLDAADRCTIHDVAPFGCRMFDAHMDDGEAENRSLWHVRAVRQSPEYHALRERLRPQRSFRTSPDAEIARAILEFFEGIGS